MVGAKRKLDTTHGPAAEGASQSTNSQGGRVTRSSLSQASRTPRGSGKYNSNHATSSNNTGTPSRRSRIIKLNTRGALSANSSPSNVRETRTLRGRASALSSTGQPEQQASASSAAAAQLPETPRVKRIKRGSVAEESPRSTRQSARIRGQGKEGGDDKQSESSPTKQSSARSRAGTRNYSDSAETESRSPSPDEEESLLYVPAGSNSAEPDASEEPEENPAEETIETSQNKEEDDRNASSGDEKPMIVPPALTESQNSGSPEAEKEAAAAGEESSVPSNEETKVEETDIDHALEQQLQNGTADKQESHSAVDATEYSRADDESRQVTDVEDSSVANGVDSSKLAAKSVNGPGGARAVAAKNRAAKGKGRPRGKGVAGRRATAGRGRQLKSPEARPERSPSPFAAAKKLLDRKMELDRAFKKVAAAQRLALHVMAVRTEKQLARDKNTHKKVPEFEKVEAVLSAYRKKKQDTLRYEYECQLKQEELLFAAEKERIEQKFRFSARHIQKEHLLAAQGDYMAFVEGQRAAEDDEHTETDGSDEESGKKPAAQPTKEFVRGFNSQSVRRPAGAAAYERADTGWEHFVQRARLGEDIDPQMKEIGDTARPAPHHNDESVGESLSLLLEVANHESAAMNPPEHAFPPHRPSISAPEAPAVALSALADVASTEAPIRTPRPSLARPFLPQPMADPRYMLPRPELHHPPSMQQPQSQPQQQQPPPPPPPQPHRPLIPGGQQIPSIEHFGLPNPFGPGSGPRQLPPPPGSNFQLPPPPGFLNQPPLYFPPQPRHPY